MRSLAGSGARQLSGYVSATIFALFLSTHFIWLSCAFGQDVKYIDDILAKPFDNQSKYYVSFCSEGGTIGHAFIAIGVDDPRKAECRIDLAIGLYPEQSDKNRITATVTEAQGGLYSQFAKRSFLDASTCTRFTVPINEEQYEILKIKMGAYADSGYQLFTKDCVTFCEEIAKAMDLKIPDRKRLMAAWPKERAKAIAKALIGIGPNSTWDSFPSFYLQALADSNR